MQLLLKELKQPASKKIADAIILSDNQDIDWVALRIIFFATEEGLGCRETAEKIALTIGDLSDINRDMFLIIKDLVNNSYFHPTPEISALIDTYFKQVGDKFNSPEDTELYGELITDSFDSLLAEENTHEPI